MENESESGAALRGARVPPQTDAPGPVPSVVHGKASSPMTGQPYELRHAARTLRDAVLEEGTNGAIAEWLRPRFLSEDVAPMLELFADDVELRAARVPPEPTPPTQTTRELRAMAKEFDKAAQDGRVIFATPEQVKRWQGYAATIYNALAALDAFRSEAMAEDARSGSATTTPEPPPK